MAALLTSNVFAAGVFHVAGTDSACSNLGPGTEEAPYCTITAAALAQGGPGTTLLVHPGIYRERVADPASGAPGDPFVIKAVGPGVVVDGTDDFSDGVLWTQVAGPVWLAASVTWNVNQVFVDGSRLTSSTADPNALAGGTFRYVPGWGLYANVGGANPGEHETLVGRRQNGFRMDGDSYITIDGFTVTRIDDIGIYSTNGCTGNLITGNTVTFSYSNGIGVNGCTDVIVENNAISHGNDHGIYVWNGANGTTVRDNESSWNVRAGGSGAKGIKIELVQGVVVAANRLHHNQDSGLRVDAAIDTLSLQNVSWANSGQGFSDRAAVATRYIGDVAYANVGSGFLISEGSQGTLLLNAIAVNNGVTIFAYNLQVDPNSTVGFASDFNVLWSAPGSPAGIGYAGTDYGSVAGFSAATGNDANTLELDPLFVDAPAGDFHLQSGSPAIDSADTSLLECPLSDADGNPRADDPVVPNTGFGPVSFAERGAFEFDALCFGAAGASCGEADTGECSFGTAVCTDGVLTCSGAIGPAAETCNGLDDDCDGLADNGFEVGLACDGAGACGAGVLECNGSGGTRCSTDPGGSLDQSLPETCDALDNDCDGAIDNGFDVGLACDGTGACGAGVYECDGSGAARCSTDPGGSLDQSLPETCDALDNDCDGAIDNGFPDSDNDAVNDCLDPDDDNDGALDNADCASLDGTAFGVPGEVHDLVLDTAQPTQLAWSAQDLGIGTQYVVAKGDITSPGNSTSFPAGVCLGTAVTNQAVDAAVPALDGIIYYMVKPRNSCGGGTFGTASRDTHPGCP